MTDDNDNQTLDLLDDAPDMPDDATDTPDDETEESPETAEIEIDGKKYSVPKELEGHFLRQSDYTRKTQELAEQRRIFEQGQEAIKQAKEADDQATELRSDLRYVDKQLQQYQNIAWARLAAQAPAEAQAAMMQYNQLQIARSQLADGLAKHEQTASAAREQAQHAALAKAQAELLQAMPDFNANMAREIVESTVSAYGYTADELNAVSDPRQVRVLRDAMLWRKSQQAASKAAKPAAPTPVKTVTPSSKKTVDPDKMSTEEWMAYERKRMSKRG